MICYNSFRSTSLTELLVLFCFHKLLSGHKGLSLLWPEATAFEKCHIEVILSRKSLQIIVSWCSHSNLKLTSSGKSCHALHTDKLPMTCRLNKQQPP